MGLFSFSMGTERVKKSEAFLRIGGLFFDIFFFEVSEVGFWGASEKDAGGCFLKGFLG